MNNRKRSDHQDFQDNIQSQFIEISSGLKDIQEYAENMRYLIEEVLCEIDEFMDKVEIESDAIVKGEDKI